MAICEAVFGTPQLGEILSICAVLSPEQRSGILAMLHAIKPAAEPVEKKPQKKRR